MSTTGIGRFVSDGRFDLERIMAATRAEPEAMQELSAQRVARLHEDRAAEQRRLAETQAEPGAEH
jgi:hypothetical protein